MKSARRSFKLSIRPVSVLVLVVVLTSGLLIQATTTSYAQGQSPATCNQIVPAVQKQTAKCVKMTDGQACFGSSSIEGEFSSPTANAVFAAPGQQISLDQVQSLTTGALDLQASQWGVALFRTRVVDDSGTPLGMPVRAMLYGDSSLTLITDSGSGESSPLQFPADVRCTGSLTRSVRIYASPSDQERDSQPLTSGTSLNIYGKTQDNAWLYGSYVDRTNLTQSGWIQAGAAKLGCQASTLPVIDPESLLKAAAFAEMTFSNGNGAQASCRDVPSGGLMIQSPDGLKVNYTIDGVALSLSGTAILTAFPNESISIAMVDGKGTAAIGSRTVDVPNGQQVQIPLGGKDGLKALGSPGKPGPVNVAGGDLGLNLKTVCDVAGSAGIQISCALARPTPVPGIGPARTPPPPVP